MSTGNSGQNLSASAGPSATAQFGAAASLVNAAEQFVPPFHGAATALTRFEGALIGGENAPTGTIGTGTQRVVQTVRCRFTGDAANVAGQTITVKAYRIPRGSTVATQIGQSLTGIATTAGLQEGVLSFTSPVEFAPGDVLDVSITPSAALTAVMTNLSIAVTP